MTARRIAGVLTAVIFAAACALIFRAYSFSCLAYHPSGEADGFRIYEGVFDCYAAEYRWDGKTADITVPDSYNGKPITSLGGFYGRGVRCACSIDYNGFEPGDTRFILHFGKNIKEIKLIDSEQFSEIIPSAQNKYFRTENGELIQC